MLSEKELRKRLQKCLDGMANVYEIEDVVAALHAGELQWWQDGDLITITRISQFPRKRILNCFCTFGTWSPEAAQRLQDRCVEFGRQNGCEYYSTEGRKGWSKTLGALGWKTTGVTLRYKL